VNAEAITSDATIPWKSVKTDADTCVDCGNCIPRCIFGARRIQQEQLAYDPDLCMGCGLCVTACAVEATSMSLRAAATD